MSADAAVAATRAGPRLDEAAAPWRRVSVYTVGGVVLAGLLAPLVLTRLTIATQAHHAYTAQYTQQTVIAAGESGSRDILVGQEAQDVLARQAQSPN